MEADIGLKYNSVFADPFGRTIPILLRTGLDSGPAPVRKLELLHGEEALHRGTLACPE